MNIAFFTNYFHAIYAWMVANPAISMPLLGAVITVALKPRSEKDYAMLATKQPVWFFTRWAAFLQLVAAISPDPVKARKVIFKFIYGTIEPMDPPKGPPGVSALPFFFLATALAFSNAGCNQIQAINAAELFAQKVQCAMQYSDLPPAQIVAKCAIQPGDIERVLAIIAEANKQKAAAVAAREQELELQRQKAGCGGYRDGGL